MSERKLIKTKLGLLKLAKELGNVSRACSMLGYSRDSYYRFKQLYEKGGEKPSKIFLAKINQISKIEPIPIVYYTNHQNYLHTSIENT